MTLFIAAAALLALIAAAFVSLPLLRAQLSGTAAVADAGARAPVLAVVSAALMLGLAAGLYLWVGNFQWTRAESTGQGNRDISQLVLHLRRAPKDLSGWLALGQQYTAIGQFHLAIRSYERASALAGNNNATALSGIAEAITLGGDQSQARRAKQLFERTLQLDPDSPKALFYTAIAAMQAGDLPRARARFQRMLDGKPPEKIQIALRKQIATIDSELHPVVDARTAIRLHITLAPALAGHLPADASLFVFVQSPKGGAPLAVKRLDAKLPQDVVLSAADAMIASHAVQAGQRVTVAARISASGNPLGATGDLYGQIRYTVGKEAQQDLQIDRRQ